MKKRILVVPSWFPTADSPATGSFCREQAELVSDVYDIRVLYPRLLVISKKKTIRRLFNTATQSLRNNLLGDLPGVELTATVSSFFSLQHQVGSLVKKATAWLQQQTDKGWKPDLIHAHGTIFGGTVAAELGKVFNIPVVITEHHSLLVKDFNPQQWQLYKNAMESCAMVATVSNELKKMILMNGIKCTTTVIGNLINEDMFYFRENTIENKPFSILFIAVPAFTKDIPTFIKSLQSLGNAGVTNFQASLIIPDVTADFTRQDIIDICREYGVAGNCVFAGNTPHEKMPAIIQSCDVLVSTSITETFGLSVAEALMCGKPVITTKSGGVEDFVSPQNGILVNIGDFEAIARAIITLMNSGPLADSKAVSDDMRTRFGKKAFKKRISSMYEGIINDVTGKMIAGPEKILAVPE